MQKFIASVICGTALLSVEIHAALLEDFEALSAGQLNGQAGWTAVSGVWVAHDLTEDNLLMQLAGGYLAATRELGNLAIADGEVGTLFFRFQVAGNTIDHTVGLSDNLAPRSWADYESTARIYPDGLSTVKVQGRDGNAYEDLTLNGGGSDLAPNTWYHLWMVDDNFTDTVDYYLHGGAITTQRRIAADFAFRNGTTDSLSSFLVLTGASAASSVYIDDIYVWPGEVLTSPIGDPAVGAVVLADNPRAAVGLNVPRLVDFAFGRLMQTHATMPANRMPERTTNGYWNQTTAGAWTSGFFAGEHWMMYQETGAAEFLAAAKSRTDVLKGQEYNGGNHDVGFRVFNSFGQGYKSLPEADPDKADYLNRILVAADTLAGRFEPTYQAIESWNGDNVIIDNMMNLELLFWAAENTSDATDAQVWRDIAVSHALTTQREHVRADGSTYHVVQFDPITGEVLSKRTAQGYANESTWSRGQAWGLYGFTMTYRFTNDPQFLETAARLADYWLDHLPSSGVVPYDFEAPGTDVPLDSSASAIASSAMLELMNYVDAYDANRYFTAAETMLRGLSSLDILTNGLDYESILREGSIAKNVHHTGLIYGDYYFIEALSRYKAVLRSRGDFDADGDVDGRDFLLWQRGNSPEAQSAADLAAWQNNYGASTPLSTSTVHVPEPNSILPLLSLVTAVCNLRLRPR